MAARRIISASVSLALMLGAYLCLGTGMEMGQGWNKAPAHACCPSVPPKDDNDAGASCCLLLPAAASASVAVAPQMTLIAALPEAPAVVSRDGSRVRVLSTGPPGRPTSAFSSPGAPRAPPAA